MQHRVVVDAQKAMDEGLGPTWDAPPIDWEALLLPLTTRERVAVGCLSSALSMVSVMDESPELVALWKCLLSGFHDVTGVLWQKAPKP